MSWGWGQAQGLGLASSLVEVEPVGKGADFENRLAMGTPVAASAWTYLALHRTTVLCHRAAPSSDLLACCKDQSAEAAESFGSTAIGILPETVLGVSPESRAVT